MKKEAVNSPQDRQDAAALNAVVHTPDDIGDHVTRDDGWPHLIDTAPFDGNFDTYDNTLPTGSTRAYVAGHWVPLATRPHVADVHALTVYGKDERAAEPPGQHQEQPVAAPSPDAAFGGPKVVDAPNAEVASLVSELRVHDMAASYAEALIREDSIRPIEAQRPNTVRVPNAAPTEITPASTVDMSATHAIEAPPQASPPTLPEKPALAELSGTGAHSIEYVPGGATPDGHVLSEVAPPRLTGRAPSGAIVEILDGDETIGSVLADANGDWTYALDTPLAVGPHELMTKINGGLSSDPMLLFVEAEPGTVSIPSDAEVHGVPQLGLFDDFAQPLILDFNSLGARVAQPDATEPTERGLLTESGLEALRLDGLLADGWMPAFDGTPPEIDIVQSLDEAAVHEIFSHPQALSDVSSYGEAPHYSDVVLPELEQFPPHTG